MTTTTVSAEVDLSSTFIFVRIEMRPRISIVAHERLTRDVTNILALGLFLESDDPSYSSNHRILSRFQVIRSRYGSPYEMDLQVIQSAAMTASAGVAAVAYVLRQVSHAVRDLAEGRKFRAEASAQEAANAMRRSIRDEEQEVIAAIKKASNNLSRKQKRQMARVLSGAQSSSVDQRSSKERELIASIQRLAARDSSIWVEN